MADAAAAIEVRSLSAGYGDVAVLHGIDLSVEPSEFVAILGSSGCGKTTLLRTIAGFQRAFAGEVRLFGRDVTAIAPEKRGVAMVFQSYALWPHMTVLGNIGYGLKLRRVPRGEIRRRVTALLRLLNLPSVEDRKVTDLSGGQRQRVALARALINRPKVLLLDEPLGALDLKLREEMQIELKRIQQEVRITFIYVTHDQEEALTMSDRLAVFNAGRIEQIGAPAEVYERPATRFVAGFVGTSNLLTGDVARQIVGRDGTFTIRPEKIRLAEGDATSGPDETSAAGTISSVVYVGPDTRYIVVLEAGARLVVTEQNLRTTSTEALEQQGKAVRLIWKRQHELPVADGAIEGATPLAEEEITP
jgi:putative spermidine/putrescine transport system ATP-binding protein